MEQHAIGLENREGNGVVNTKVDVASRCVFMLAAANAEFSRTPLINPDPAPIVPPRLTTPAGRIRELTHDPYLTTSVYRATLEIELFTLTTNGLLCDGGGVRYQAIQDGKTKPQYISGAAHGETSFHLSVRLMRDTLNHIGDDQPFTGKETQNSCRGFTTDESVMKAGYTTPSTSVKEQ